MKYLLLLFVAGCGMNENAASKFNEGADNMAQRVGDAYRKCINSGCDIYEALRGENGKAGTNGADGRDGVDGSAGPSGSAGTSGSDGAGGTDGASGADGSSCSVETISAEVVRVYCTDGSEALIELVKSKKPKKPKKPKK